MADLCKDGEYHETTCGCHLYEPPKADINAIQLPLAEVRAYVAGLMRDGQQEMPLGDFLYKLKDIYLKAHDEAESLSPS